MRIFYNFSWIEARNKPTKRIISFWQVQWDLTEWNVLPVVQLLAVLMICHATEEKTWMVVNMEIFASLPKVKNHSTYSKLQITKNPPCYSDNNNNYNNKARVCNMVQKNPRTWKIDPKKTGLGPSRNCFGAHRTTGPGPVKPQNHMV